VCVSASELAGLEDGECEGASDKSMGARGIEEICLELDRRVEAGVAARDWLSCGDDLDGF
jgi:hypothetical protein